MSESENKYRSAEQKKKRNKNKYAINYGKDFNTTQWRIDLSLPVYLSIWNVFTENTHTHTPAQTHSTQAIVSIICGCVVYCHPATVLFIIVWHKSSIKMNLSKKGENLNPGLSLVKRRIKQVKESYLWNGRSSNLIYNMKWISLSTILAF